MTKPESPKFVVAIFNKSDGSTKYLKKYVTLKRVDLTEQKVSAKTGLRSAMIKMAYLLRMNGFEAWAEKLN